MGKVWKGAGRRDEVGESSSEVQVMLLRVLETGELYPVGASKPVATDVRLVAATDADLEAQIADGRFRAPLLHRLAGYEPRLSPLRERREDIGPLFLHFARSSIYDLIERSPSLRLAGDLSVEELTLCFHACRGNLDEMVKRLEVSKRALNRRVKELGRVPKEP